MIVFGLLSGGTLSWTHRQIEDIQNVFDVVVVFVRGARWHVTSCVVGIVVVRSLLISRWTLLCNQKFVNVILDFEHVVLILLEYQLLVPVLQWLFQKLLLHFQVMISGRLSHLLLNVTHLIAMCALAAHAHARTAVIIIPLEKHFLVVVTTDWDTTDPFVQSFELKFVVLSLVQGINHDPSVVRLVAFRRVTERHVSYGRYDRSTLTADVCGLLGRRRVLVLLTWGSVQLIVL